MREKKNEKTRHWGGSKKREGAGKFPDLGPIAGEKTTIHVDIL